jgi:hypothetical protein
LRQVVAIGLTPAMLVRCATTLAALGERVTLCRSDFDRGRLGDGFDLVFSGSGMHHLDEAGKRDL